MYELPLLFQMYHYCANKYSTEPTNNINSVILYIQFVSVNLGFSLQLGCSQQGLSYSANPGEGGGGGGGGEGGGRGGGVHKQDNVTYKH